MAGTEPNPDDALPGDEIRKRAVAGAAVVGARGVAINVLAFLGNVALARLLVPEDYGTIALGLAILTLAMLLSDGGLGAGLVRRPEPPTADDMRAFMAVQLGASLAISGLAVAIGVPLGGAGPIVAIMLAGLPILALRGPALVWLQRQIDFRPLAAVEVSEVFAYYTFGIAAVAAGLGVWGLAAASVVKALTGTALLLRGRRHMVVRPRAEMSHIRPMLRFGLRFQGVQVVGSIRD
jgi:O-antigen/teichoic acid export membrane protein